MKRFFACTCLQYSRAHTGRPSPYGLATRTNGSLDCNARVRRESWRVHQPRERTSSDGKKVLKKNAKKKKKSVPTTIVLGAEQYGASRGADRRTIITTTIITRCRLRRTTWSADTRSEAIGPRGGGIFETLYAAIKIRGRVRLGTALFCLRCSRGDRGARGRHRTADLAYSARKWARPANVSINFHRQRVSTVITKQRVRRYCCYTSYRSWRVAHVPAPNEPRSLDHSDSRSPHTGTPSAYTLRLL